MLPLIHLDGRQKAIKDVKVKGEVAVVAPYAGWLIEAFPGAKLTDLPKEVELIGDLPDKLPAGLLSRQIWQGGRLIAEPQTAGNLLIAGSRSLERVPQLPKLLEVLIEDLEQKRKLPRGMGVISGGARGVDKAAEHIGRPTEVFPARWSMGKSAGYVRNLTMAKVADAALILWDGQSKGTRHMIATMQKRGKPVFLYRLDQRAIARWSRKLG